MDEGVATFISSRLFCLYQDWKQGGGKKLPSSEPTGQVVARGMEGDSCKAAPAEFPVPTLLGHSVGTPSHLRVRAYQHLNGLKNLYPGSLPRRTSGYKTVVLCACVLRSSEWDLTPGQVM